MEAWFEPKGPIQLLLWRTSGCDIDREEEFLEVDEAIVVAVESPEDMRAELLGITWIIKHKLSTMPRASKEPILSTLTLTKYIQFPVNIKQQTYLQGNICCKFF